jgi:cell division protein ZapA
MGWLFGTRPCATPSRTPCQTSTGLLQTGGVQVADVLVSVGGRSYRLACRDGEEEALRAAARHLDARAMGIVKALGALTESRLLLMAGLQVVSELHERAGASSVIGLDDLAQDLEALATRLESIAGLEPDGRAS